MGSQLEIATPFDTYSSLHTGFQIPHHSGHFIKISLLWLFTFPACPSYFSMYPTARKCHKEIFLFKKNQFETLPFKKVTIYLGAVITSSRPV